MIRTITHKHLKRQFDIFDETGEIDNLLKELQFSTLLLPVEVENGAVAFPILHAEDKEYAPVFTDIHEYNKCDFGESFRLFPKDFNFYLELLDERIDGIIIDVDGERFPLTEEFKDFIRPNPIIDCSPNVLTLDEIKHVKDSIENAELEDFLKDESNRWDSESLMELLFKSDLFKVVLSKDDLSNNAQDGVVPLDGQLPTAVSTKMTERYALIYTNEGEIKPKNSPMHPYLQLVNLTEFINRVLLDDLDGIILNENSQNITIPRNILLDCFGDFESSNENRYDNYAFVLSETG